MNTFINKTAIVSILDSLNGKFVTIDSIKKDGVSKFHANGILRASPASHVNHTERLACIEINGKGVRTFLMSQVVRIAGNKQVFETS